MFEKLCLKMYKFRSERFDISLVLALLKDANRSHLVEIAMHAEYDNHSVNSMLFRKLAKPCIQDKQYKWFPTSFASKKRG